MALVLNGRIFGIVLGGIYHQQKAVAIGSGISGNGNAKNYFTALSTTEGEAFLGGLALLIHYP